MIGGHWRIVLVYKFDEDGNPLDYQYFPDSKQVVILKQQQKQKLNARLQVAEARRSEDAEIDDLLI